MRLGQKNFSGASLDRRKFFDLLDHDVCDGLLNALGVLQSTLEVEKRFYNDFTFRYKVGDAISDEQKRIRG